MGGVILEHVDLGQEWIIGDKIIKIFCYKVLTLVFHFVENILTTKPGYGKPGVLAWIRKMFSLTMYFKSMKGSLMATTLMPFWRQALRTRRPIRPKLQWRQKKKRKKKGGLTTAITTVYYFTVKLLYYHSYTAVITAVSLWLIKWIFTKQILYMVLQYAVYFTLK